MRPAGRQGWGILLSHHGSDELHLAFPLRLGRRTIYFCARCAGLYPGMLLVFLGGSWLEPWPWWLEWSLLLLAPLPAMLDWATSTASGKPERSNLTRMLTGIGLGMSIGAMLHVNTRDLLGVGVRAQLLFFLASVWLVWFTSYLRRSGQARKAQRRPPMTLQEYVMRDVAADRSGSGAQGAEDPPDSLADAGSEQDT